MELTVNGNHVSFEPLPGEMLSDLLRQRLGLTGTKIGCNESECGACTVLVDGEPVLACTYPSAKAAGTQILTIEGLAQGAVISDIDDEGFVSLHPLQQSFVLYGAVQCGFCIPGQIMTAYALLQHNPNPSETQIRQALKDTLCRCAGYPTIIRAIQAAAEAARLGVPVAPPEFIETTPIEPVIGKLQVRPDAVEKVTGGAKFTDDLSFEGMLVARVKRAGLPHAILRRIDVSKARQLPGVAAVLTADEIPGDHLHGIVIFDWPVLVGVDERVRYVGDAVAIVAAETADIAAQALDLIEVEYDPQPVISDPVQAHRADVPALHPNGNLLKHIKVRKGELEQGFADADVILEHTYHTATTDHAFLDPSAP